MAESERPGTDGNSFIAKALPQPRDDRQFLRALVETSPDWIAVMAADRRLLTMNPGGLAMIEAPDWHAVSQMDALGLVAPEHRLAWAAHHDRVCRGEKLSWQFDAVGFNGVRRHMETRAVPIELDDGTTGQLAMTRDITARKVAERDYQGTNDQLESRIRERSNELAKALVRLDDSERSFKLLVRSVTDYAIYMLDPTGNVASWNAGAERIKGYTAEEIIGRNFSCFYMERDRLAQLPQRGLGIAAREGRFEAEGWRVRKDGSRFWANVVIDAIYDDGRVVGFAKVTKDISEKRAAEARLRQAQKMEAIGQFTGGAAHDFNNLLMAILGSLELLRKRLPNDRRMLGFLDNALQGARRGTQLTQRMLAFARRQELKQEPVDLAGLIDGVRDLLERSIGSAISIVVEFPPRLPLVLTDAAQLEAAVLNLTLNARDAMPAGGTITISGRDENLAADHPAGLPPGRYGCLAIEDTGQGIDEATLARVTEPFFTTKGIGKGTGLGLSMVDGLIAQSGGKMQIQSEVGRGTKVELWLPVAEEGTAATSETPTPNDSWGTPPRRHLVILAVDDDILVLTNTVAMLEDMGHRAINAASGEEALAAIDADPDIDLVISDQGMPKMTGIELSRAIRARRPGLPVIIATGYAELPSGSDDFAGRLSKPFSQRDLAEAVGAIASMDRV